jgi:peroxiredoxin
MEKNYLSGQLDTTQKNKIKIKMWKWLIWTVSMVALGFGGTIILNYIKTPKPKDVPEEIISLPAVNLLLTDSQTIVNTANIKKNRATVFFFFDPNCEHCQHETEEIIANKDILKKVRFYFISLDSIQRIKKFVEYYRLKDYPEITVAKDFEYKALSTFKIESIPTNLIYNSKHKIVAIFSGGIGVKELKKVLDI